ncbi:MAG: hypothetical protein AAGG47_13040 [Pseudomonadota bacterium]
MAATGNPAGMATGGVKAFIKASEFDGRQYKQIAKQHKKKSRSPHHETSDNNPNVIAESGNHRVVRCSSDVQLIVQVRSGSGRWPWVAIAYVLSASRLPDVLQRRSMGIPAEDVAALLAQLREVPA